MLNQLKQKVQKEITQAKSLKDLEEVYGRYLGRKGELTEVLHSLKDLSSKEQKEKGRLANQFKQELEEAIRTKQKGLGGKGVGSAGTQDKDWLDVTAPGQLPPQGHLHPITLVQRQIEEIFQTMGFSVMYGPEAETEYYNFDALNIPKNHPARDLWDTFWLKSVIASKAKQSRGKSEGIAASPSAPRNDKLLLRTHTSPMQARYMEKNNPPLRIIVPGRCFRHEATDATHDFQFYQVEGLMIGEDVSMANFKGVIDGFLERFYGQAAGVQSRLRPSYFPFTEPSFEVDVKRKGGKWLELMGAGMVHPNVLKAVGYKPGKWQGFAFGMGPDRLAMLKYQIDDIRLFYSGDLRFLKQF